MIKPLSERKRPPTHPGEFIKYDFMEPLGLSVTETAKVLKVSRKTLSMIINGRASVTSDMALRLSQAFKTTPQIWLNLQQNHDLWHALHDSKEWKHVKAVAA